MPQSRVNADGSVTYWPDGWDEQAAPEGVVSVNKSAKVESKVVDAPAPAEAEAAQSAEVKSVSPDQK